jgi:hypothetical protein
VKFVTDTMHTEGPSPDPAPGPAPVEGKLELLPNTFDCAGRTWLIRFTDSNLKAVERAAGVDLWKAVEIKNSPLVALGDDERKLRDAVWAVIGADVVNEGISKEDFYDDFNGDRFDAAFDAIQGGLERFFSGRRRAALRQAIHFLAELGKADLKHKEEALNTGLASMIEAGKTAIESTKTTIKNAMVQEARRAVNDALQPASKRGSTSSNVAATSESLPTS